MKKLLTYITPHPDRVLVKITRKQWDALFSKKIIRDDGSTAQLFTDVEESEGYDRRFGQNVSVGTVVAVGANIENVSPGDTAIIDYKVSNDPDITVGYKDGDKMVALRIKTTYHEHDAVPGPDGRRLFNKGDFDEVSPVIGLIRKGEVMALSPYVILVHESRKIIRIGNSGIQTVWEDKFVKREVIAAAPGSGYKKGDKILIQEYDLFSRHIDGKEVSICFEPEIIGVE